MGSAWVELMGRDRDPVSGLAVGGLVPGVGGGSSTHHRPVAQLPCSLAHLPSSLGGVPHFHSCHWVARGPSHTVCDSLRKRPPRNQNGPMPLPKAPRLSFSDDVVTLSLLPSCPCRPLLLGPGWYGSWL